MITIYSNKNLPRKEMYLRWIEFGFALCTPLWDVAFRIWPQKT